METKTFDQLLADICSKHNIPDISHDVKVAIVKAMAPNFLTTAFELADCYQHQELDDEDFDNAITELANVTFCLTPDVYEAVDREFDFEEWVENAEGPPHDPRCINCGAPLQQENGSLCYECETPEA